MRRVPAELIPRVPEPARKVARNAVWTFGRATSRWRPLPGFLVIGAQKAGTTALYAYLRWHPAITGPSWTRLSRSTCASISSVWPGASYTPRDLMPT